MSVVIRFKSSFPKMRVRIQARERSFDSVTPPTVTNVDFLLRDFAQCCWQLTMKAIPSPRASGRGAIPAFGTQRRFAAVQKVVRY